MAPTASKQGAIDAGVSASSSAFAQAGTQPTQGVSSFLNTIQKGPHRDARHCSHRGCKSHQADNSNPPLQISRLDQVGARLTTKDLTWGQ